MGFTHSLFICCRVNILAGTREPIMRFVHQCDVCNKEFTRQWNLERHKQIHEGTDPEGTEGKSMLEKLANGDIQDRRVRGYSESTNESSTNEQEEEEEQEEEQDPKNEFWEQLADQVIGSKDVTVDDLPKLRKKLISSYKSKVRELQELKKDPVHRAIMSKKRKLEIEEDHDSDEAFESVADQCKFMMFKAARFREEDFNDNDHSIFT